MLQRFCSVKSTAFTEVEISDAFLNFSFQLNTSCISVFGTSKGENNGYFAWCLPTLNRNNFYGLLGDEFIESQSLGKTLCFSFSKGRYVGYDFLQSRWEWPIKRIKLYSLSTSSG